MATKFTFAAGGAFLVNVLSAGLAAGGAWAVFSRIGTIVGFAEALSRNLGPVTGNHLLIALSMVAGSVIQMLLVAAWRSFLREGDMLFLGIGLMMSLLSATMSATTTNFFTNEAMISRNLHAEATGPAVDALRNGSDAMRDAADAAQTLASQASTLNNTEDNFGGTCTDVTTDPGDGPRRRLRERHKAAFSDLSQRLNAISNAMYEYALDIMSADEAETEVLYRKALGLTRSSDVKAIATRLAELREDVTTTFFDAQNNKRYSCQTPDFAARIANVEAMLTNGLKMEIQDVRTPEAGVGHGFLLLKDDVLNWITGERPDLPTAGRVTLLLTLIVEFLQVTMLVADFRQRRRSGRETDRWDRFHATYNKLTAVEAQRYEQILTALDRLTLRSEGRLWLVHGEGALSGAARQTIDHFDLDSDRAFSSGKTRTVPLARLVPEWVDARRDVLEGDSFTLYCLPRGIDHWRRRARRDVQHYRSRSPRRGNTQAYTASSATAAE
ncbi:hypothetical protein [Aliiruegeria sabulilitoris]|uniref:hypothetical protein n=1 Tax=Aliiruegeria sabulilitoris TaxID=1510458 RepID=UPI00082F6254|nr:hypothetical protein [Aliiruegeria sabulilitoris]NDR55378.1 hypothetical protein [Pseudoruegeria sp. M32A2M]